MSSIIPSTKFKVITVHKMQSTTCWRQFFWSRVMNLEPRGVNFNFWFGGVLHSGFEALLLGKSSAQVQEAMAKESRRRTARYSLTADNQAEMTMQFAIIQALVRGASRQKHNLFDFSKMKLKWAERQLTWQLNGTPCTFCARLDGFGTYGKDKCLYEIKTARTIDDNYFAALEFDTQICSYMVAHRKDRDNGTKQCCYCVFRKPQKRMKKEQSPEEFTEEIAQDLLDRPDFYYVSKMIRMGSLTIKEAESDIESTAAMIADRYNVLTKKGTLLEAQSWPRQTRQCLSYGVCPYLILCRHPKKYEVHYPLFQQRELLYSEEKNELQRKS